MITVPCSVLLLCVVAILQLKGFTLKLTTLKHRMVKPIQQISLSFRSPSAKRVTHNITNMHKLYKPTPPITVVPKHMATQQNKFVICAPYDKICDVAYNVTM